MSVGVWHALLHGVDRVVKVVRYGVRSLAGYFDREKYFLWPTILPYRKLLTYNLFSGT